MNTPAQLNCYFMNKMLIPGVFAKSPGIYIHIPGDFLGIFIPGISWGWGFFGDGNLFSWDGDIPPKSHL